MRENNRTYWFVFPFSSIFANVSLPFLGNWSQMPHAAMDLNVNVYHEASNNTLSFSNMAFQFPTRNQTETHGFKKFGNRLIMKAAFMTTVGNLMFEAIQSGFRPS